MKRKPVMLVVLDGWGISSDEYCNAICMANTPMMDSLRCNYPYTILECSGEQVGLPTGQMGNSEVGHLNIGAGRVVYQELTRITKAIREGKIKENQAIVNAIQYAKENNKALHLMGLLSDGGVHSHIDHLIALLRMAKEHDLEKVYVHAFLDGRDVQPKNAKEYIIRLEQEFKALGVGQFATVMGRYYAMDRDKRWDRVAKAYSAMVDGEGLKSTLATAAIERAYDQRITDEFVDPTVIVDDEGNPKGLIGKEDAVIFYNFRADRAREISHAFVDTEFEPFVRQRGYLSLRYVCMTQYEIGLNAPVAFPPQNLVNTFGEYIAEKGLKQLRIAETEKYAHVTFFFNGGVEEPNENEDRILIPSPKVATYNLQPEMSAYEVTDAVLEKIKENEYDVIILNYANADMVGHTGQLKAAIKAIETVDNCVGRLAQEILDQQGVLLITADHGNAELMADSVTGQELTAHSSNPVPCILVSEELKNLKLREGGSLQDIAPTLLELLGIEKPEEMTGVSLIAK